MFASVGSRPTGMARSRSRLGLLASLAAAGLLLAVAAPAQATATITRTDITGMAFTDPCTGEQITITGGTFQLIVHATSDAAGGLHLGIRGNAQGVSAVGSTSGTMYRLAGDFRSEQNVRNGGYPLSFTIVEVHNAVSAGSADNFIVHIIRHLTISAGGDVTSTIDAVSAECRG